MHPTSWGRSPHAVLSAPGDVASSPGDGVPVRGTDIDGIYAPGTRPGHGRRADEIKNRKSTMYAANNDYTEHHTEHDAEYWWKRVQILEHASMPTYNIPPVIVTELSRIRLRILSMLTTGNIISCAQIILTTRCKSNSSVKVHLCYIRKELAKHDIELTNVFGVGYWIDPINLELFRKIGK